MRGWADPALYFETVTEPIAPPANVSKIYIVQPGDTLWKIAQKFYGNGIYWRKIWDNNRNTIPNPNLIRVFQILKLL